MPKNHASGAAATPPPFIRVEIMGISAVGADKIVLTRETWESNQVKIETSARVIYCPTNAVRAALASLTLPEAEKLEGN